MPPTTAAPANASLGIVADVTWNDSGPKILRAAIERFGRLDILINNAGINTGLRGGRASRSESYGKPRRKSFAASSRSTSSPLS